MTTPCSACPWIQRGTPDVTDELRAAAADGTWFCCHVNMGTCHGARRYGESVAVLAQAKEKAAARVYLEVPEAPTGFGELPDQPHNPARAAWLEEHADKVRDECRRERAAARWAE